MSGRPTPETDAAYFDQGATMYSMAGIMKRLERERDEARAETKRIRDFMDAGFARAKDELDDHRNLLREIFNLTQIGDPHPEDLPMKALQAIAEMIDEHLKEARK